MKLTIMNKTLKPRLLKPLFTIHCKLVQLKFSWLNRHSKQLKHPARSWCSLKNKILLSTKRLAIFAQKLTSERSTSCLLIFWSQSPELRVKRSVNSSWKPKRQHL